MAALLSCVRMSLKGLAVLLEPGLPLLCADQVLGVLHGYAPGTMWRQRAHERKAIAADFNVEQQQALQRDLWLLLS